MSAADIIREQAEQHGIARVTDVWLEVGALADVEESALHFCFDIACRDTVAQGCTLHIDVIPHRHGAGIAAARPKSCSMPDAVRTAAVNGCASVKVMICG